MEDFQEKINAEQQSCFKRLFCRALYVPEFFKTFVLWTRAVPLVCIFRTHEQILTFLFPPVLFIWTYVEDSWTKCFSSTENILQEAFVASSRTYAVVVWLWRTKISWSLCWNRYCQCWSLSSVSVFDLHYKIKEEMLLIVLFFLNLWHSEPKKQNVIHWIFMPYVLRSIPTMFWNIHSFYLFAHTLGKWSSVCIFSISNRGVGVACIYTHTLNEVPVSLLVLHAGRLLWLSRNSLLAFGIPLIFTCTHQSRNMLRS